MDMDTQVEIGTELEPKRSEQEEITSLIPQRAPFLFVDRIIERKKKSITTSLTLRGDEDFFRGHFPGNPIMPGVLIQEALFQTGALLMSSGEASGLGVVTKVGSAKFKGMVRPGDVLEMEVKLEDKIDNAFWFKGKARVNDKVVTSIEFQCAQIPSDH